VDIILGGQSPEGFLKDEKKDFKEKLRLWQKEHDKVVELGGLYVVGTEKHESRRIDNQLRGRAGRQGDPGESCFFVSLEDDLMRIFGGEQISRLMTFFNFPEDQPLSHSMVSRAIEQAQIKVEGFNFDIRKHLVEFDDVLNKQREIIYGRRRKVLFIKESETLRQLAFQIFLEEINRLVNNFFTVNEVLNEDNLKKLVDEINFIFPVSYNQIKDLVEVREVDKLVDFIFQKIKEAYFKNEKKLGLLWQEITKSLLLNTIDYYWTKHLTAIEDLREGINLYGYAQIDPLVAYKNKAYMMFEKLLADIDFEFVRRLFKIEVDFNPIEENLGRKQTPMIFQSASAVNPFEAKNKPDSQPKRLASQPIIKKHKLGRNDPCWCGSGKKYKKCHWPN
jgi:preprotein translocase subunit SecA